MRRLLYQVQTPTADEAFQLPHSAWNKLLIYLRRNTLRMARADEIPAVRHPWATAPSWDGRRWTARVKAGFVAGRPAVVEGVPLTASPVVVLSPVPEPNPPDWFARRWPFRGSEQTVQDLDSGIRRIADPARLADVQSRGGWRVLWAAPVTVTVARPWVALGSDDSGRVEFTLRLPGSTEARVSSAGRPAPVEPTPLDLLRGGEAPSADSIVVATVYLLSPGGAGADAEPDAGWTPYVRHHVHDNLTHAVRVPELPEPFTVSSGARGFGADIVTRLEGDIEQRAALADVLRGVRVEGGFWSV